MIEYHISITYQHYGLNGTFQNKKNNIVLPVPKQGGGMIDLKKALNAKLHITPGKLALNDSVRFSGTVTIKITNIFHETVRIKLDHLPAGSVRGFFNGSIVNTEHLLINKFFAKVSFPNHMINLRPKETKSIKIKIKEPSQLSPREFGVYSGFIIIKDTCNQQTYSVPYQGLKGNLNTMNIFSNKPLPSYLLGPDGTTKFFSETDEVTFTFQGDQIAVPVFNNNLGTALFKLLVVVPNENTLVGTAFIFPYFPSGLEIGIVWDGTIASGNDNNVRVILPNGRYQLIIQQLKPFGDPNNPNQFESWRSPIVIIDRP
jgi:hypothetical protein